MLHFEDTECQKKHPVNKNKQCLSRL